jgi:glutathione S-transferase
MTKPKLIYFEASVSRGEECRLALHLAGVDFEDARLKREEWVALKPNTPYGSLPILELPGKPPLAQSNAILTYVGRAHDLHPKDEFEAARHEAMMMYVEDCRVRLAATMRITDADEKKRVREELAATYVPEWARHAERQVSDSGPFFAGEKLYVVDLKILLILRWLRGGALDHIPKTVVEAYPKLNRVHDAAEAHPGVKAWYAKR